MNQRDLLKRRIRISRIALVLQTVAQLTFAVAVWNCSDVHRNLLNRLWYMSLFVQLASAFILGRRISEAKLELDR